MLTPARRQSEHCSAVAYPEWILSSFSTLRLCIKTDTNRFELNYSRRSHRSHELNAQHRKFLFFLLCTWSMGSLTSAAQYTAITISSDGCERMGELTNAHANDNTAQQTKHKHSAISENQHAQKRSHKTFSMDTQNCVQKKNTQKIPLHPNGQWGKKAVQWNCWGR